VADLPSDIPGLAGLQAATPGDPDIVIALLDGPVDTAHPVLRDADLAPLPGSELPAAELDDTTAVHGTHVASVIFGQPGTAVQGVAPAARGIVVPLFERTRRRVPQLEIARAIERALEAGAKIINISGGEYVDAGVADDLLGRALARCEERGALIVAAAGNDSCECLHVPAALRTALAVGAHGDDGEPLDVSNWGEEYLQNGIVAPGESIMGAVPGSGTIRASGTSAATPIVSGVAALLAAREVALGRALDLLAVRKAILKGARPCPDVGSKACRRMLGGILSIEGAIEVLDEEAHMNQEGEVLAEQSDAGRAVGGSGPSESPSPHVCTCGAPVGAAATVATPGGPGTAAALPHLLNLMPPQGATASGTAEAPSPSFAEAGSAGADPAPPDPGTPPPARQTAGATQSSTEEASAAGLVYAIGTLGYDFGTEARRDSFKQLMDPVVFNDNVVPPNPHDSRQMVAHLERFPTEADALIWTLNLELTPLYAVVAKGPFAMEVYAALRELLAGEIQPRDSDEFVDRMSLPGRLTDRRVKLFSGQAVPVVEVDTTRGLYGWRTNWLIEKAVEQVAAATGKQVDRKVVDESLGGFLNRIYYDMRNLGVLSGDRALNFAATNAFQAASAFAEAVAVGMHLDAIDVELSPYARQDADAWDVKLKFFDPENLLRSRRVFRFTVDVSEMMPVTLGDIRTWSTSV
jgi:cyanobactin maturation PatA/PatG family protease